MVATILREVIPDGTQWGSLGDVIRDWRTLEFGQDLKSASSIRFDYPVQGAHYDKLKLGMYVTPFVNGTNNWYDSIFYVRSRTGSLNNPSSLVEVSGVSLRSRLDKVRWMPAIGSSYADGAMFRYNNVTPGTVIKSGVENYWSRAKNQFNDPTHWLSNVYVSSNQHWAYRVDDVVEAGTSVNDMITRYQDLGMASARFRGFHLITGHYDWFIDHNPAVDKTDTVQLREGFNIQAGEFEESNESQVTSLLVRGAEDPFAEFGLSASPRPVVWVTASQTSIDKWGYHEEILDVPEASSLATLEAVGRNYLDRNIEPRHSRTYVMVDNLRDPRTGETLNSPNVFEDFQCGDSITVLTSEGATTYKVYAISVSYDNPQRPVITLTLNDYFDDLLVTFDQRLRRLGG